MKNFYLAFHTILFYYFVSCSDESREKISDDKENKKDALVEIQDLDEILQIDQTSNSPIDFENLLKFGNEVKTSDVSGVLDKEEMLLPQETISRNNPPQISTDDLEAETAFKNLEVNSLEHKKSIEDLRIINQKKDQTIASLSLLNDELISEIKRIKGEEVSSKPNNFVEVGSSNSNLGSLKTEVKKLKNNLALKSEELKSLRYRNDSLEGRITQLESAPNIPKDDLLPRISKLNTTSKYSDPVTTINLSGNCNLQFEAVVTSLNGKSKEAFYTEFFVLPYNLEQIVRKGGIELNNYSEIDTYAELWARSRKNAFLFPDIHKKIRSLLLDFEDKGEGKRIRTDVDGSASISGIKTGKYYVIGTAALGKVGVTWSVPVTLNPGNNKISLTLANCSWSL
jgi:regulator of replication initiation timing